MKMRALSICILMVLFNALQARAQVRTVAIEGGTLIDGTGAEPFENAVVLIEGSHIRAIGEAGDVPYPPNTQVVNAKGKTILPGLIDTHVHFMDWMPPMDLH